MNIFISLLSFKLTTGLILQFFRLPELIKTNFYDSSASKI